MAPRRLDRRGGPYRIRRSSRGPTAASGAATPQGLIDIYPAQHAYSLRRRLSASYAGAAYRVERDSDNAQTDIGFDAAGLVDTAALATFCGASVGTLITLYDQSGNGEDLDTSTNKGEVYDGASAVTLSSGDHGVRFAAAESIGGTIADIPDVCSVFCLLQQESASGNYMWTYTRNNQVQGLGLTVLRTGVSGASARVITRVRDVSSIVNSAQYSMVYTPPEDYIMSVIYSASVGDAKTWLDGSSQPTVSCGALEFEMDTLALGAADTAGGFGTDCAFSEYVAYYSDQSANRTAIEADISTGAGV